MLALGPLRRHRAGAEPRERRSTRTSGSRPLVRNHADRHFPVQNVAKATYREILERRARENAVDFVKGLATAITPVALFEAVMVRSWETLVDHNATVDVNTGMVAASKLQALVESRAARPAWPRSS